MKELLDKESIKSLIKNLLNQALNGSGALKSAEKLAEEYSADSKYESADQRVNGLIKWETSKNFGTGFISGLGGAITLPVTIPASMYASWLLQARLSGAIATLYGYSVQEDRVQTFILLSLIGDAGKNLVKNISADAVNAFTTNLIKSIPVKLLSEINEKVGFKLISKAGEKGGINIMKIAPVAGGFVSGIMDSISCYAIGKTAKNLFKHGGYIEKMMEEVMKLHISEIERIIKANTKTVKKLELLEGNIFKITLKKIPLSINLKYMGFKENSIILNISENFIKRKILEKILNHFIKKLDEKFRPYLYIQEDNLIVDINYFINNELQEIRKISIKNIEISQQELVITF